MVTYHELYAISVSEINSRRNGTVFLVEPTSKSNMGF